MLALPPRNHTAPPKKRGLDEMGPKLAAYLARLGYDELEILGVDPLVSSTAQAGLKAVGYGQPLRIRFRSRGQHHDVVLRTMKPDRFGHDRRADRIASFVLAYDTFDLPKHVEPLDAGCLSPRGELCSLEAGEPFLLTRYVEGELYASDLARLASLDHAGAVDKERVRALALYLADLHSFPEPPEAYHRALRDTIGSGEGIFGITDSYAEDDPVATRGRLIRLEERAVEWRWWLKSRSNRAKRIHGDFHPFNILFRADGDFAVLDRSRGGVGDPADDVTCLSINFAYFAMLARGRVEGALLELWDEFWGTYLEATRDRELFQVVAPFFAWRALVLASPLWYPNTPPKVRDRMLHFAELLLAGRPFLPENIAELTV